MTSLITRYGVYDPALSECGDGRTTTMDLLQSVSWEQSTSLLALQTSSKPQPISVNTVDSIVQKNAASGSSLWKQHASLKSAETINWEPLSLEKSVLALQHLSDSPSVDNYLCILQKCRKSKSLAHAMFVHVHLCSHGVDTHSVLESHAVSLFVDCESIRYAQSAFNRLNRRSEFVWTCLLQGYVNSGEPQLALDLVQVMKDDGIVLSKFTFVALLKACAKLQLLERGQDLHKELADLGIESDLFVGSILVDMYAKCGSIAKAQEVFDGLSDRSIVSWTALISGYAEHGPAEKALRCLDLMDLEGISLDAGCYICSIKACGNLEYLFKGMEMHSEVVKKGLEDDQILGHVLMDMYAKCNSLEETRAVFDKLPGKNVVSWTILISRYVDHGQNEEALRCLEQMQVTGECPNDITLVCSLRACRDMGATDKGREIHAVLVREDLESVPFVCNTLIDFYVKLGTIEKAHLVFEESQAHDVILWTTLITGYAEYEHTDEALRCFQEMQREGLSPDVAAYNAVISACAAKVKFEMAFRMYLQMQERGLLPNNTTIMGVLKACKNKSALAFGRFIHAQIMTAGGQNAVDVQLATVFFDMYAKCGSILEAQHVFDNIPSKDIVAWTALITGYAGQGEIDIIFELLGRMKEEGKCPDGETFLSVLIACTHAGLVEEGQKVFESMRKDFGITPTLEHLNCLVDLLGRVGRLNEAVLMLNQSSISPDPVMWGTVLGACRKWRDMQVARHAFGCAITLDSSYTTAYSLMANIYADAGLWEEVKMIEAMKAKQG
ncbi:hypothetical protein L7F22_062916 [Adiantum nelumboides]|nr:hypothetical protein [Adiantum nelumboides]